MSSGAVSVRPVPEEDRYELLLDEQVVGRADFRREGDRVDIYYTVVDPALQGRGLAGVLADFAVADLEAAGLEVTASCSYVRARLAGRES